MSRAWIVKPEGKVRVHHRSCPHWAAGLCGRNQWQTIDEVLALLRSKEVKRDEICGTCGTQLRAAYDDEPGNGCPALIHASAASTSHSATSAEWSRHPTTTAKWCSSPSPA